MTNHKFSDGRRNFIKNTLFTGSVLSTVGIPVDSFSKPVSLIKSDNKIEWRNKQEGMSYRQLGRTGLMVSEMVIGAAAINPNKYKFLLSAIEKGINYIDTAWRYGNHKSEMGVAELIKLTSRDKLFIATKLSPYLPMIDQIYQDIYKALPSEKQKELVKKADQIIEKRMVRRPGYHYDYFPNHKNEFTNGYLTFVMANEYGSLSKYKSQIKKTMHQAINESLTRLQTDYIDVLFCPHGARLPEELDDPSIFEVFEEAQKQGKVRFSGVSIHTDVPNVLNKAVQTQKYDIAMVAYNIINQASIDMSVINAAQNGMGLIAMKAARVVNPSHTGTSSVPQWRIDKLNEAIPGDMKIPLKAYLWVLQNPNISAVISDLRSKEMIEENIQILGKETDINSI